MAQEVSNMQINGPKKSVPSLFRQCVKGFVSKLDLIGKPGMKIVEFHELPAVVLTSLLVEMSCNPLLCSTLHRQLTDPVLFMRVFMHCGEDRKALEKCLGAASLTGKPVLPELVRNWCNVMGDERTSTNLASAKNSFEVALKFGTYLLETGWFYLSIEVLDIALGSISPTTESHIYSASRVECIRKILRAQTSALLRREANVTCSILLSLIKDVKDNETLTKVFMEVANHYCMTDRVIESFYWTSKAMELITGVTQAETIIGIMRLKALYYFSSGQHEAGSVIIGQAFHRGQSTPGYHHPKHHASTLYAYGVCLLNSDCTWEAIPVLLDALDFITKLYGPHTPHAAFINSYLAYAFHRRSEDSDWADMAYEYIQKAIALAKEIMPEQRQILSHFEGIRTMILDERCRILDEFVKNWDTRFGNFQFFSAADTTSSSALVNQE